MTRYNSGAFLGLNYESDYNAIRRFIISNPGINNKFYKGKYRDNTVKNNIYKLIKYKQSNQFWHSRWLIAFNWFHNKHPLFLLNSAIRQCPFCATECYHSHVYLAQWFRRCPIHESILTEYCPECGQKWPTNYYSMSRRCQTCGRINLFKTNSLTRMCDEYRVRHNQIFRTLWDMSNFMAQSLRLVPDDYWHNESSDCITFYDKYFPSVAEHWNSKSAMLLSAVTDNITSYKSLEFPIDNASPIENIEDNREIMSTTLHKELNKILEEMRKSGVYDNYEGYDTEVKYLYYNMKSQVSAVKLTFELLSNVLHTRLYFDIWVEQMFNLIECMPPRAPVTPFALISNDVKRLISIPKEFVQWYAEMSVKQLYLYIYRKMLRLCIANRQTIFTFYKRQIISNDKDSDYRYTAFNCCVLDNEHLQVIYHPLPSWKDIICNVSILRLHSNVSSNRSAKFKVIKDHENLEKFDYSIYENKENSLRKDLNDYLRFIAGYN